VFGDEPVDKITKGKIKDFLLGKVNEGFAGSTVTHMKNVLSGFLNKAVDDEILQTNPVHTGSEKYSRPRTSEKTLISSRKKN
jgi:hypothetical protein